MIPDVSKRLEIETRLEYDIDNALALGSEIFRSMPAQNLKLLLALQSEGRVVLK